MISLSRNTSRLVARTSLTVVLLSVFVFGAWTAGGLNGQPPAQKKKRAEEEEDTPKNKKPKRIIPVEDEKDPKAPAKEATKRSSRSVASGNLSELAEQETRPALQTLYHSLAVPHDWASYKVSDVTVSGERKQRKEKIKPIPFYLGNNPDRFHGELLQFTPLTFDWKEDKPRAVDPKRLESVRCYEEIAQDTVRKFLSESHERLSRSEMLEGAEKVLTAVLNWHDSAIEQRERDGKEWDSVKKSLNKQLLEDVLLKQMELLAQANNWEGVLKLAHRLAAAYGRDAERQHIFKPVAGMIERALKSGVGSPESKQKARERLHKLEMEFPDNPAFKTLRDMLRQQAQSLLDASRKHAEAKNDAAARLFLDQAEKTWPQLPGLREFKNELNNDRPVLRVGVRGPLPKYFAPAWACTENEWRAVDMLFESLVKRIPDGAGGFRYRRGLAEFSPKVVPLGRQFQLPRTANWSNGRPLGFSDIGFSLDLLQNGKGVGRSRVWGDLLVSAEAKNDSSEVTMRLKQGFLDPLAAINFKILPGNLPDNVQVFDEEFAKNPVTSGPFRKGRRKSDEARRDCQFFEVNPYYSIRPTKRYTPHIQEVRFFSYDSNTDIVEMLVNDQLDLALDLTAKEFESLRNKHNSDITAELPSPAVPNRRIYFLAINTSKLDDATLRRALSCAIDREDLLTKHFRGSLKSLHKALSGPFPVGSWACEQDNRGNKRLFDADAAVTLSKSAKNAKAGPFTLKYASGNPAVDEALKDLCGQVKERTGVVLEPTPCDPYQLREDVEQTKNYDVAYYHYDFPDEIYWLMPLFGPPPGAKDSYNIFNYDNPSLSERMEGTKNNRNFARVRGLQQLIRDLLNREMPLVPLWQLDPLLAYRRVVQPAALDPLQPFGNIEEWRMQRK